MRTLIKCVGSERAPPPPAVALRGVRVDFGDRRALDGVDLDLLPGTLTVIAGPNGAGKSTLLEVVAGTRAPAAGTRSAADRAAFVPQRAAVSDRLPVTVRDVVTVGAWGRSGRWRRLDADARRAVDDALDRLGLIPLASQGFAALSGGQRQRALLAQGWRAAPTCCSSTSRPPGSTPRAPRGSARSCARRPTAGSRSSPSRTTRPCSPRRIGWCGSRTGA
ncbi:ATP-binding cassette domain-containing protein [Clavibacter tessellarius]